MPKLQIVRATEVATKQMGPVSPVSTAIKHCLPGKLNGAELNGSSAKSVYVITRLSRLLTLEIPVIFTRGMGT